MASVTVNPTVDGVSFNYGVGSPVSMTEDGAGVTLDSLFNFPDTSEVIDSLIIGQSTSLNVKLSDETLVSLADRPYEVSQAQINSSGPSI